MLLYLLKSTACLSIFLLFYKWVLEKEQMHQLKRFYLLGALCCSFCIPLITFTYYINPEPITEVNPQGLVMETSASDGTSYLPTLLWSVYGLGVLVFGIRFIKNLLSIRYSIKTNETIAQSSFLYVLLKAATVPHTFFNYIFLNTDHYKNDQIPAEVLLHEQAHAKQKHSIDILFIEIIQVLFWFNPLLYFIKKAIKLNHEFLADEAVLNQGTDTKQYQELLLASSSGAHQFQLANAINYSSIKKRFTVMKTQTSRRTVVLRSLLLLPLFSLLLLSFSSKETIVRTPNESAIDFQEGVPKKLLTEYNKLAQKYHEQLKSGNIFIKKEELERMEAIYKLMSPKQRKSAVAFPVNLPPPPKEGRTWTPADPKAPKPPKPPKPGKRVAPESAHRLPPPPPPPTPLEGINNMAKKGATFFYNGKKITANEARQIAKKNKSINVWMKRSTNGKPSVELSDN